MEIIAPRPLPPALPLPAAFDVPEPTISVPTVKPLEWEPVPIYADDIPPPLPAPSPNPAQAAEDAEQQQDEQDAEEGSPNDSKNESGAQAIVPELAEVQTIVLPIIDIEIPIPRTEILATAATTAGISSFVAVGGTIFAQTLFRQLQPLLKPIFKKVFKKLAQVRKKPPPLTYARQRLLERRQHTTGKKGSRG